VARGCGKLFEVPVLAPELRLNEAILGQSVPALVAERHVAESYHRRLLDGLIGLSAEQAARPASPVAHVWSTQATASAAFSPSADQQSRSSSATPGRRESPACGIRQ